MNLCYVERRGQGEKLRQNRMKDYPPPRKGRQEGFETSQEDLEDE